MLALPRRLAPITPKCQGLCGGRVDLITATALGRLLGALWVAER